MTFHRTPRRETTMKYSRRDLGLLLPALAAATASGQNTSPTPPATEGVEQFAVLQTAVYLYKGRAVAACGQNKHRRLFTGKKHSGFQMESPQSDIAPGEVNHPPH